MAKLVRTVIVCLRSQNVLEFGPSNLESYIISKQFGFKSSEVVIFILSILLYQGQVLFLCFIAECLEILFLI